MISLKRIAFDNVNWKELTQLPDCTVFQTRAWLSFLKATQKQAEPVIIALEEAGRTVGYFTGVLTRRFGLRILGSPFPGWTTPYMGFCLGAGISRRHALNELVRYAFQELRCAHVELMDRQLNVDEIRDLGLKHRRYSSLEIDLTQSDGEILAKMSPTCRRWIRKGERSGLIIEEANDSAFVEEYYAQLLDVFAKQSLTPTYGVDRVQSLIDHLHPTGMLLLVRARDKDGRCIATGIFPAMNQSMYFWGGASWRTYQQWRPNEPIQWYAMQYWKKRGIQRYDMIGMRDYKKKYGGREIFVPWIRKSKYPVFGQLRNCAEKLVSIRQKCVGAWNIALSWKTGADRPVN
jgi:CelD/BcsL family acetyltransferase involved in cellulose biosynthesis